MKDMNNIFAKLNERLNDNAVFDRLNDRLNGMAVSSSSQMKDDYVRSVSNMNAEHAAAVADMDMWWKEVEAKHAAAEAAMEAEHREFEARQASNQAQQPVVGGNLAQRNMEEQNRLQAEQNRLFMEQQIRMHHHHF